VIVRVLTARVKPGRASHFNALIRQQQDFLRAQPGLVYIKLARRLEPDGSEEVVLFEEWRDPPSLYAWAGLDIKKPRLPPGWEDEVFVVTVTHYEALDLGPEDLETVAKLESGAARGPT
jgi:hypothetical protein